MSEDRKVEDDLRRLKVRVRKKVKGLWRSSDKLEPPTVDNEAPSEQTTPDSQQSATKSLQEEQPERTTESVTPALTPHKEGAPSAGPVGIDTAGWDKIWAEAYKRVKEDPKNANLLTKFELFLESRGQIIDPATEDDASTTTGSFARLKTIQKIAEEQLTKFEEGKLSFNVGSRPIVVRESIVKAVDVINAFKPIVSGAIAAEPTAALAWAGITTALPILEGIFKQDENAATGLTEITFLMARYQIFHEPDFASHLQSTSHSLASRELLQHIKTELVSIYAAIYIYEARFILQYATRSKMHRAVRNALNADEWKGLWSEIQSKARRVDDGIRDQVSSKTLEAWNNIKCIESRTGRIESLQEDTLKAVMVIDRRQLLQSLKITGNAMFDSRQTSNMEVPCMPGTQFRILKTIQDWAEDPTDTMIFWLEGMAGTGKTSISMTVASALKEGKALTNQLHPPGKVFLGASFFFNQVDATRNSTVEFFTTVAWCLSTISPDNGSPIIRAIRDNPGIETKSPQEQFRKLIADPLASLDKHTFVPFQLVVVIDALDECDDKDAETMLGMLENLAHLSQVRLRLFITSRRETHISRSFMDLPSHLYRTIRLEKVKSSLGQEDDITFYLSKTLKDISTRYRVKDGGISISDLKKLAKKADGLFIYAVTACRFLNTNQFSNKVFRDIRLSLILEQDQGPQQEIDGIYLKVLKFPELERDHETLRDLFYSHISRLIGFIVVLLRPVSVDTLCNLLPKAREEIDYYLGYLHAILNIPDDPQVPVTLIHLSFRDFILDEKRSALLPFSVKELDVHCDIFNRCLELMNSDLHQNMCCLELPGTFVSDIDPNQIDTHIPQYLRYACLHWVKHLSKMHGDALDQNLLGGNGIVHTFLQKKLLFWLEVLAFIGEAPAIIPIILQLGSLINPSGNPGLLSLVRDARTFIRINRWIIEHAPMQIYCSALLFCPCQSGVRLYYQHLIPDWISTRPKTEASGTVEVFDLHGHTEEIYAITFSPTEHLLASVSDDLTTRVWDYITGSEQHRFQDPGRPLTVCFSMDGLKLASGCSDGTICVRDLKKATDYKIFCPCRVHKVSFSPTASNILAALSKDDGMIRLWDLNDRQQVPFKHACLPDGSRDFVFSPEGQTIAVRAGRWVAVFDIFDGKTASDFKVLDRGLDRVGDTLPSRPIEVGLSIDSRIIALRLYESIEFWDLTSSHPKLINSYGATFTHRSFLSLPTDETLSLNQSPSGQIELFEKSTGLLIGKFQMELGKMSHDGLLLTDGRSYHPVIRAFSDSSVPSLDEEQDSAPQNVQLLDCGIALSFDVRKTSKMWNVRNESPQSFPGSVTTIRFAPDETFILLDLDGGHEFQIWSRDLTDLQASFKMMADVVFCPHTCHLVTLSLEGELRTWEWDAEGCSFKPIWRMRLEGVMFDSNPDGPSRLDRTLYLSRSGQEAIVTSHHPESAVDSTLSCQLWSLAKEKRVNEVFLRGICNVAFSSNNEFFIVVHECHLESMLLQTSTGNEVKNCDLDGYLSLTFHPVDLIFAGRARAEKIISVWEGLPWTKKLELAVSQDLEANEFSMSGTKLAALLSSPGETRSEIKIWDIVTGENIYSFGFPGYVDSFEFSIEKPFLESRRGRIPLPFQRTIKDAPGGEGWGVHQCLYILDEWIFQGHERLLWLPAEYRPFRFSRTNVDIRGGLAALAHKNNSVVFIGVKLEKTPVAARYRRLNR